MQARKALILRAYLTSLTSGAEGTKKFLGGKLSGSTWKSEAGVTGAAALLFNTSTYLPLAPEEDKTKKIEHGCERTRITQKVITASSQQLTGSGNWRNGKVCEIKVSVVEIIRKHDKIRNQIDNAIASQLPIRYVMCVIVIRYSRTYQITEKLRT